MNRLAEVFLDAAYAIALSSPGDQFHAKAEELAERMERENTKIFTTRAVLLEIGNALAVCRRELPGVLSPAAKTLVGS